MRVATAGSVTSQIELDLASGVLQLSPGGMRIRLTLVPEIGSRHGLTLVFEGQSIEVSAVVRDVKGLTTPNGTPTCDVGVEFDDLTLAERGFVEAFLARQSKSSGRLAGAMVEVRDRYECWSCTRAFVLIYQARPEEHSEAAPVNCPHCGKLNYLPVASAAITPHAYRTEKIS